jgi:hypothetical protein
MKIWPGISRFEDGMLHRLVLRPRRENYHGDDGLRLILAVSRQLTNLSGLYRIAIVDRPPAAIHAKVQELREIERRQARDGCDPRKRWATNGRETSRAKISQRNAAAAMVRESRNTARETRKIPA